MTLGQIVSAITTVLLSLSGLILAVARQAPEPTLQIVPAAVTLTIGEEAHLSVVITDLANLGAFQFDFVYDAAVVEVKDISVGAFAASTGRSVNPLGPKIDAEVGRAVFGAFSFGDTPGPSGTGSLAEITLIAKQPGQTRLVLGNVQVVDVTGAQIGPVSTRPATITVSTETATSATRAATLAAPIPTLRQATSTVRIVLSPTTSLSSSPDVGTSTPLTNWIIVGGALLLILLLVVVLARQLAS